MQKTVNTSLRSSSYPVYILSQGQRKERNFKRLFLKFRKPELSWHLFVYGFKLQRHLLGHMSTFLAFTGGGRPRVSLRALIISGTSRHLSRITDVL